MDIEEDFYGTDYDCDNYEWLESTSEEILSMDVVEESSVDVNEALSKASSQPKTKSVLSSKVFSPLPKNKTVKVDKNTNKTRKRKSKKETKEFSSEEKKQLAKLVEQHAHIWDLNHKHHSNNHAIASSWKKIAMAFPEQTETDCKAAWRSLKASSRYHKSKKGKKGNTGDSADEELLETEDDCPQWEYTECMNFLQPMSQKYPRKTSVMGIGTASNVVSLSIENISVAAIESSAQKAIQIDSLSEIGTISSIDGNLNGNSASSPSADDFEVDRNDELFSEHSESEAADRSEISISEQSDTTQNIYRSNYEYATQSKKKDALTDSVVTITKGIADLVHCRKVEMQNRRVLTADQPANHLKFEYMWANFDTLMQMLPPADIVDLNLSFLKLIHEKVNKNTV